MNDATPITRQTTALITAGVEAPAIVAVVEHLFPGLSPAETQSRAPGRDRRGGAAGGEEALIRRSGQ